MDQLLRHGGEHQQVNRLLQRLEFSIRFSSFQVFANG